MTKHKHDEVTDKLKMLVDALRATSERQEIENAALLLSVGYAANPTVAQLGPQALVETAFEHAEVLMAHRDKLRRDAAEEIARLNDERKRASA